MFERNLLEGISPVTQTIESGKALAKFLGLSEELPESIALANGARLTLSNKGDCFYVTSPQGCSCPEFAHRRTCEHMNALKGSKPRGQTVAEGTGRA